MTTVCKRVCPSICLLAPLLILPVCLTAPSVLCSLCLLYDVLWAPRVCAPVSLVVSLEVFNCSPQPLKAGIVATAMSRRLMEFSVYNHSCIIAGTVVACSVCVLIPFLPPVCSPAPLLTLPRTGRAPEGWGPVRIHALMVLQRTHCSALHVHLPRATRHPGPHP